MTANLRTQPQLDKDRVFNLALFHARAFFYYVTYNETTSAGGFWRRDFWPLMFSLRGDWGNAVQRAFMTAIVGWEPRFLGGTADGMFKVAIRRHPDAETFSWALEWNENVRVIGYCGDCSIADAVAASFPKLDMRLIQQPDGSHVGVRIEKALSPDEDRMFYWSDALS